MPNILRSTKSIYDLFELYIPGHHILNRIPNNFYKNHYIYQHALMGVSVSIINFDENMYNYSCCNSGCNGCTGFNGNNGYNGFNHNYKTILDYKIEDILAMKLHHSYYTNYHIDNDKLATTHLFDLLNLH